MRKLTDTSVICSFLFFIILLFSIIYYPKLSLAENQPTDTANIYFQGVYLLEEEKNYSEALRIFREILEDNPNHAEAHFQIGNIYRLTH